MNTAKKRIACMLALALTLCACGCTNARGRTVVVLQDTEVTASPSPETPTPAPTPTPAAETPSPAPTAEPMVTDWYGWWRMDQCSGDWAHMYGYYWDCCAEIGEDGEQLSLLLWDEDLDRNSLLAQAQLSFQDGTLTCAGGSFLDRALEPDGWSITWTRDDCGSLLHIEGTYEAVGSGGFWYEIFLRPWGSLWPGSEDEKPYYYEDWYLPLIEAGLEMPDEIGVGT